MIQAQELRIGNFLYSLNGQLVQVSGLTQRVLTVVDKQHLASREAPLNYFKPVHLSDEVLERSGFAPASRYDSDNIFAYTQMATNLYLQQNGPDAYALCISDDSGQYIEVLRTITALHELQNCFYALTGQELELKSEPIA